MKSVGPPTYRVDGHSVQRLAPDDTVYSYICRDCGGHAHELDDYRGDECISGVDA
jgi:hypothetical protein